MFYFLSKTIGLLLNPVVLLLILLLIGLLIKKPQIKKSALWAFTVLFLVFTNTFLTNEVALWWEVAPIKYQELTQDKYAAAIVLSGITVTDKGPADRVHLHKGADRILHAVQLYKQGIVKKIIISGGSGLLKADTISEAARMQTVMELSGIPPGAILLETASRNTYENAAFTRKILNEGQSSEEKYLLVTSAFHMRRAIACFNKQGIRVTPFSTDFYTKDPPYRLEEYFVPAAMPLLSWDRMFKEWFGMLTYRLWGYI